MEIFTIILSGTWITGVFYLFRVIQPQNTKSYKEKELLLDTPKEAEAFPDYYGSIYVAHYLLYPIIFYVGGYFGSTALDAFKRWSYVDSHTITFSESIGFGGLLFIGAIIVTCLLFLEKELVARYFPKFDRYQLYRQRVDLKKNKDLKKQLGEVSSQYDSIKLAHNQMQLVWIIVTAIWCMSFLGLIGVNDYVKTTDTKLISNALLFAHSEVPWGDVQQATLAGGIDNERYGTYFTARLGLDFKNGGWYDGGWVNVWGCCGVGTPSEDDIQRLLSLLASKHVPIVVIPLTSEEDALLSKKFPQDQIKIREIFSADYSGRTSSSTASN